MGQTRLLLLVLGVIVATIAIVMGIRLFNEGMTNANFDSLLRDSISIASSARVWKEKPQSLGGSPDRKKTDPTDYSGATFQSIGYSAEKYPMCYSNQNGLYAITPTSTGLRVIGTSIGRQNRVVVLLRGSGDGQIVIQDGPVTSQMAVKGGYFLASDAPTRVYRPIECSGRSAGSH